MSAGDFLARTGKLLMFAPLIFFLLALPFILPTTVVLSGMGPTSSASAPTFSLGAFNVLSDAYRFYLFQILFYFGLFSTFLGYIDRETITPEELAAKFENSSRRDLVLEQYFKIMGFASALSVLFSLSDLQTVKSFVTYSENQMPITSYDGRGYQLIAVSLICSFNFLLSVSAFLWAAFRWRAVVFIAISSTTVLRWSLLGSGFYNDNTINYLELWNLLAVTVLLGVVVSVFLRPNNWKTI